MEDTASLSHFLDFFYIDNHLQINTPFQKCNIPKALIRKIKVVLK